MLNHRTLKGSKFSEGARLLWLVLESRKVAAVDIERTVGASTGLASSWLNGDKRPGLKYALLLEEHFQVPASSWESEPTEEFVLPAARKGAA